MKTKEYSIVVVLVLLTFWLALCNASAFYGPGTQRWLNRDPIAEAGGINLYEYANNSPTIERDSFGLQVCPKPSSCWQSVSDFYCGEKKGMEKALCKAGLKLLFRTPGAKTAACLVQQSKCTACCATTYDDIDQVDRCIKSCNLEYAKCLIQSF